MVITHNLPAMNAQRQFDGVQSVLSGSMEKLSSGYKINRAGDDAAGLTISEKMRVQIKGLNRGSTNIQDGISLVNVADGALEEIQSILQRMNELAVQAANDTNTVEDRKALNEEVKSLSDEITRIGKDTRFNTKNILDDVTATDITSITQLVRCKAANSGYLQESVLSNSSTSTNPKWYPAAKLDFSGVTAADISKLAGKGFSFTCSVSCPEEFEFKFKTDGTANTASNLTGQVRHIYEIDISQCQSGADIVLELYNFVAANQPNGNSGTHSDIMTNAIRVSHSNDLAIDGAMLYVYANHSPSSSQASAEKQYPRNPGSKYGAVDASSLVNISDDEVENEFWIQCSSNKDDKMRITTHKINAKLLGVDGLSLTTHTSASKAITKVQEAIDKVSGYRSELGAYTNRLETSYNNVRNSSENIQRSESFIRDTDMAEEMMNYTKSNILAQAGNMMLAQANLNNQGVLQLLAM